jgi:hypothetical protein
MFPGGMVPALSVGAVPSTLTRVKLSALVLVAVVIGLAGAPLVAETRHCDQKPHDCGKVTRIAPCCCGDHGDASNQGGPVETGVQINPGVHVIPALFSSVDFSHQDRTIARLDTSPPRGSPLDLPTLFASLLI